MNYIYQKQKNIFYNEVVSGWIFALPTMTTIVYMYRQGFRQLKVGYASAIAILFFLIVLAVSILQRKLLKQR